MTDRAARTRSTVPEESTIVPSANSPLTLRVRAPAAAASTGGGVSGGQSSATPSSFT
jgi:hypothetical protein